MSVKIKNIHINAFRGIPDLELPLDGKSLLLRGENGTGKSSIVEAIEFFLTEKVSNLEGVRGLSLRRHGPHVRHSPKDVRISVTFDPGSVTLQRTFSSAPSPPKHLEDYFDITRKGTFILRRSQILEFIMSRPAERFKAIGSIIGVESLDEAELEMMRLRDELDGELISKESKIGALIDDISSILGVEITDINGVLPALNRILTKAGMPTIKSIEKVGPHARKMLKSVKRADRFDRVTTINEVLGIIDTPFLTENLLDGLGNLNKDVKHLLEEERRVELSLAELLGLGRKVIGEEEMDICPLCEQRIERKEVLERISERLKVLRNLTEKASEIRKTSVSAFDTLRKASEGLVSLAKRMSPIRELSKERKVLLVQSEALKDSMDKVSSARDLENEIPVHDIAREKENIDKAFRRILEICKRAMSRVGLSDDEIKVLEVVRLIEQVRTRVGDIKKIEIATKTFERYYDIAERIFVAFSEIKKKRIQEVYDSIQGDIRKFYSSLHPNDPHKNIELTVAPGRRASTELKMESFGRDGEDPRALTSEGHLDSLGLCIFLAFVKKFNKSCPLIVLDDVVTTVDSRHREDICKLLLDEFRDNQFIITTHDGLWFEQLCAHQRAYGIEDDFKNMTIVDWDLDGGPNIRPSLTRWEHVQERIADGDKISAGSRGRLYLEWVLEMICGAIQVPITYKKSRRFEVGDMLPPAVKRSKNLIKDNSFKTDVLNAFKDLKATVIMGNLLVHNNPMAEQASIDEVKSFCVSVHNLHGVFSCPSCGHFISYFPKPKIIRCPNKKCKDPMEVKAK